MRFLPRDISIGRPGLQARLDGARERWFEIMRAELPGSTTVVEDWPAMLTRAGLTDVVSFTYLLDLPAPLGKTARVFLHGRPDPAEVDGGRGPGRGGPHNARRAARSRGTAGHPAAARRLRPFGHHGLHRNAPGAVTVPRTRGSAPPTDT